tara:strand:- start:486 stop:899 length:414 start_codon:yes stop_codon:yes gene_type:complete
MKPQTLFLFLFSFLWNYLLYAGSSTIAEYSLDTTILKFMILGLVVPPVAVYMLIRDQNTENPDRWDIGITILLSAVFVWMGYELHHSFNFPLAIGLLVSFVTGLGSLKLAITIRDSGIKAIVDIFSEVKNWAKNKLQ